MSTISIRSETPGDYGPIRDLIVEVFRQTFGSGEAEATLVEQIRQQPGDGPMLSLVALLDGVLAGHVLFSAVQLEQHPDVAVCALGPLGVYRRFQRQGVGSKLLLHGLEQCRELGYRAVFVQGSPDYYPRFGFESLTGTRLHTSFESEHDMGLDLEEGRISRFFGLVDYPEPWLVFLED